MSFDVDGLDPALCPNTGTPVPGGLDFHATCRLLERLAREHRIVGFDLCEVAPGEQHDWNENVGARLLYKLCGFTLMDELMTMGRRRNRRSRPRARRLPSSRKV